MAEYIDREALQSLFNEVSTSLLGRNELTKDAEHMVRAFLAVTEMIQDAPAADVAPVVHGRWIHDGYRINGGVNWCHCSECGKSDSFCARTNYCPNCGAKMNEKEAVYD